MESLSGWKKIQCCVAYENHFSSKDTGPLKVKGGKMLPHANGNQKRTVLATLISDKADFKFKIVTRE